MINKNLRTKCLLSDVLRDFHMIYRITISMSLLMIVRDVCLKIIRLIISWVSKEVFGLQWEAKHA